MKRAPKGPTLGTTLRTLRKARGLTQREVADTLSVHFTYISKLENDRTDMPCSEKLLVNLARLYGASSDELIAAANRVPEDIIQRLSGDLVAIRAVRALLG